MLDLLQPKQRLLASNEFPFEVAHIGEPANNMPTLHWHEFMEISYVQKGSGKYEIEGKTFIVNPGDIIIINNIEKHRVSYVAETPLYETVIHFSPTLLWSLDGGSCEQDCMRLFKNEKMFLSNKPNMDDATRNQISLLISEIIDEYIGKRPYYNLMLKSKLLALISIILRKSQVKYSDEIETISKRNQIDRLEKILSYIADNYENELSLDIIAQKFYMNPSYFSDYFKKNMGINFTEYLSRLRIIQALDLINTKDMNSADIAYSCGFNNVTSFYKAFRKITGMSPGDYKRAPSTSS